MFTTTMYRRPMMIQVGEEQLHQHHVTNDSTGDFPKRDFPRNMYRAQNGAHNNNNRFGGKKQEQWTANYSNVRIVGVGPVSQNSQPAAPVPHDSNSDSSSEEFNDLAAKGVKRLHELNGSQTQFMHSLMLNTPPYHGFPPRRSHSPHHKRRHHNGPGSPPHKPTGNNLQPVVDRYLARSQAVEVRDTPTQLLTGSQWDQLSTEMWHKFMANQQTTDNYVNKMKLFKRLYTNIKAYLRYSVFVVGSTFNGFGSHLSDLDLCLVVRGQLSPSLQCNDPRTEAIHHLLRTNELLNRINFNGTEFQRLELIEAKVPLLKFRHSCGVEVDVNCNNPVGIRNTHLLHCYAKADWRVQPLVLVVKLWASAHQINDAKNMTISSYSLALMVIHFLQCGTHPAVLPCLQNEFPERFNKDREIHEINIQESLDLPPSANTQSLGELLLQFFHYYNSFNYAEDAISIRTGSTLPIEICRSNQVPKNELRAWSHLCIEEPFDQTNTARAVYDKEKFEHILRVLRASYDVLQQTHSLHSIFHLKVIT